MSDMLFQLVVILKGLLCRYLRGYFSKAFTCNAAMRRAVVETLHPVIQARLRAPRQLKSKDYRPAVSMMMLVGPELLTKEVFVLMRATRGVAGGSPVTYFECCPICSVPKVPIPFKRKLNTTRFSLRKPTLKVENCAVIAQQSQL